MSVSQFHVSWSVIVKSSRRFVQALHDTAPSSSSSSSSSDRVLCLQNADRGREGAAGVRLRRDAERAEGHGPEHRLCLQLSGGYLPKLDPPLSTRCSPTLLCVDGQGPHHHGHDRGVPGAGRAGRRRAEPQAHGGGQE